MGRPPGAFIDQQKAGRSKGFSVEASGAVTMSEATRKAVLVAYQEKKQEEIEHPYLKEKSTVWIIAHVQAQLLAAHLRGDLETYPAFVNRWEASLMMVLITYDVSFEDGAGEKRLRHIAKICLDYGVRVPVFRFLVPKFLRTSGWCWDKLFNAYDPSVDSLRFYKLGKTGATRVEHHGAKRR